MFCVVEEGRDGGEVGSGGRDLLSAPGRDEGNQQGGRGGGNPTATIGHIHHLHNGQICDILH